MEERPFSEIKEWLLSVELPKVDLVVAIARGGIIPGAMVAQVLDRPLEVLRIRYRDDQHHPLQEAPKLLENPSFVYQNKDILLVDDVSRSGKTLEEAKNVLEGARTITTLTIIGEGDYSFHRGECFWLPWRMR